MIRPPLRQRLVGSVAALAVACGEVAPGRAADAARDTTPPFVALLADSIAGDSAAFRELPPSLREELDLRAQLTPRVLADSARALCQKMDSPTPGEERRRLRLRLGPDTTVVLFVRADRLSGSVGRVELVRRPRGALQSGYVWDGDHNQLSSVDWIADRANATSSAPVPRSSPAPRAVRALGRLLLTVPCTGPRLPLRSEHGDSIGP